MIPVIPPRVNPSGLSWRMQPAAALDRAFARIAQIEDRMTVNREDSEVIRVNAAAGKRPVAVTPDVLEGDPARPALLQGRGRRI